MTRASAAPGRASVDQLARPAATDRTPSPRSRALLWAGTDPADEARVRGALLTAISALEPDDPAALDSLPGAWGAPGDVRVGTVAATPREALVAVRDATPGPSAPGRTPRPVGLLLPGQGSQHEGMAAGLYGVEPTFTETVDEVLGLFGPEGAAVRADWLGLDGAPGVDVHDTRRAQPLLFAVDLGLGRLVRSWGIAPVLLGHSAGEVVGAVLAGVLSLGDAVVVVRDRVLGAADAPAGGMLAVALGEDAVDPYVTPDVALAAVNGARQVMLAGPHAELAAVRGRLEADEVTVAVVPATTPFHSPALVPQARAAEAVLAEIALREPELPLWSGYTGTRLDAGTARAAAFWADQLTRPVRFGPALEALLAEQDLLLLEAGAGWTLTSFARRQKAVRRRASTVVPMLPASAAGGPDADRAAVAAARVALWTEGHHLVRTP